jgi:hypothetical protein
MIVLLMSLGIGKLLENAAHSAQRSKEAELLHVGHLYRDAIRQYCESTPIGSKFYPERLEDLLRDPRYPVTRRYLRRLYLDPVTGLQFVPIPAPEGGLKGVHSSSTRMPLRTTGFSPDNEQFRTAGTYQAWEFSYAR